MKTGSAKICISQSREENSNKGLGRKQAKGNLVSFSCKKGFEKYKFNGRNGTGGKSLKMPVGSYRDTKIKKHQNHI